MIEHQSDIILTIQAAPIAWEAFKAEFMTLYAPGTASSKNTRAKYEQVLRLVDRLGVTSTAEIAPELVARFIASRPPGESPHTTRSLLMHLRTACSYAEGRRYCTISPFRLRRLSRWVRFAKPAGKRHLTRDEVRRILDVLRGDVERKKGWALFRARRLYALVATVAYTGLRKNEALFLWVEDIDLGRTAINLVPRGRGLPDADAEGPRFKTESSANPIAFPSALMPILADWLSHRLDHCEGFPMPPADRIPWLFPGSMRRCAWTGGGKGSRPLDRLKAAAKRAGIEGVTFSTLRRTWATLAEAEGVPQALITRQLRHTSELVTRAWYQQKDLDELRNAVEGFEF